MSKNSIIFKTTQINSLKIVSFNQSVSDTEIIKTLILIESLVSITILIQSTLTTTCSFKLKDMQESNCTLDTVTYSTPLYGFTLYIKHSVFFFQHFSFHLNNAVIIIIATIYSVWTRRTPDKFIWNVIFPICCSSDWYIYLFSLLLY